MQKITRNSLLQSVIILLGIFTGAFFSNLANGKHHEADNTAPLEHEGIDHGYIEIDNDATIPKIEKLEISQDALSGWNLYIQTSGFKFTPKDVGKIHKPGEGHAHLIINGKKAARLYGNWVHIPELKKEENHIEVTLNANSHAIMTMNDIPISKTILLKDFLILENKKSFSSFVGCGTGGF